MSSKNPDLLPLEQQFLVQLYAASDDNINPNINPNNISATFTSTLQQSVTVNDSYYVRICSSFSSNNNKYYIMSCACLL